MDTHLVNKKIWGGGAQPWSIEAHDLLRHAYILGQTGTGKSALLQRLATAHINEGAGVALIDPHGDLADVLLDSIPRRRTRDLIYFNPAGDTERPLSINLLDQVRVYATFIQKTTLSYYTSKLGTVTPLGLDV